MPSPSPISPQPKLTTARNNSTATPLGSVLALTALCSVGTGIFWNGVPFIAEHDFGYGEVGTLGLSLFLGVCYITAAFSSGWLISRLDRFASPRTLLGMILVVQGIVCIGPWAVEHVWMIWVVTGMTSLLSAILWPLVESYLTAGRHGRAMRLAIGWWNIIWMAAVGVALLSMSPLMAGDSQNARFAIVLMSGLNMIAVLCLLWFDARPLQTEVAESHRHMGSEYRQLLNSCRVMLPMSYVLLALISPLMPYLLNSLDIESASQTPLTATWMFARVACVFCMWKIEVWHGRWGTLLSGGVAMVGGFGLIVLSTNIPIMIGGLILFGAGHGTIYFAAIYYAMAVGNAEVEASSKHEGLIGVGYAIGPLIGIAGILIARNSSELDSTLTITALTSVFMIAAAVMSCVPYFRARQLRT